MQIRHLDCGTLRPPVRPLVTGDGRWRDRAEMVCHCLLLIDSDRVVLVDTGLGTRDAADPMDRLGRRFTLLNRPPTDPSGTAVAQLAELGIDVNEVTDVLLTHPDCDHAGGLDDVPAAAVHLTAAAHAAVSPTTHSELTGRLRPGQWAHRPSWNPVSLGARDWFGFAAAAPVPGLDDVLLVDLDGHLRGHAGVAVRLPGADDRGQGKWLLHAGDAFFHHRTLAGRRPPAGIGAFELWMRDDVRAWRHTRVRLRKLAETLGPDLRIVNSHDPVLFPGPAKRAAGARRAPRPHESVQGARTPLS